MLNKDRLNNVSIEAASATAFALVDSLQNEGAETQVAAFAVLTLLVCERYGVPPQDVMTVAKNLLADDRKAHQIRAIRRYVENEL